MIKHPQWDPLEVFFFKDGNHQSFSDERLYLGYIRHIFAHCFHKHAIIIHCGKQGEGMMSKIYSPGGKSPRYSSILSRAVVPQCLR